MPIVMSNRERPPVDGGPKDNKSNLLHLRDGRTLEYFEYGDPDGIALVYCHGFPSTGKQAELVDDIASTMRARIISLTRPGMGRSTFQPDRKITDFPKDVKQLMDSLGIKKFGVLGVSGGGPYALATAVFLPKEVTVVGIANSMGRNTPELRGRFPLFSRAALAAAGSDIGAQSLIKAVDVYSKIWGKSPVDFVTSREGALNDEVRKAVEEQTKDALAQGVRGPARELYLMTQDWEMNLRSIKAPVHVWQGYSDKIVPIEAYMDLVKYLPKPNIQIYPKEGHYAVLAHSREVLSTLLAYG